MKIIIDTEVQKNWSIHKKIVCIYKITNLINGKVYIGQTRDFRKRVGTYLSELKYSNRLISQAIKEYGSDNFTIEIVTLCKIHQLDKLERYYINQYRSNDRDYGYNDLPSPTSRSVEDMLLESNRKRSAHIGLKESNNTKRNKSNKIFIIRDDTIIISDSAKLYGDYINATKDQIKNYIRYPLCKDGFYLFYVSENKRNNIYPIARIKAEKNQAYNRYLEYFDKLKQCKFVYNSEEYYMLSKYFNNIYYLSYDNIDLDGRPILEKVNIENTSDLKIK